MTLWCYSISADVSSSSKRKRDETISKSRQDREDAVADICNPTHVYFSTAIYYSSAFQVSQLLQEYERKLIAYMYLHCQYFGQYGTYYRAVRSF